MTTTILTAVLMLATLPQSQLQRVTLPLGKTTVVQSGRTKPGSPGRHKLKAAQGQVMRIHITSKKQKAVCLVYFSDGTLWSQENDLEADWSGVVPTTTDYVISVYSVNGPLKYTLELTIR